MAKKGLIYLMNQSPEKGDFFLVRRLYRFVPNIKNGRTVFIELEIYPHNICVISFYEEAFKSAGRKRYQIRSNIGPGEIKARFKACLDAFYHVEELHGQKFALVFAAANDVGIVEEDNARYSAYKLFLNYYLREYENYIIKGSLKLNTLILYHELFTFQKEADEFYKEFDIRIEEELLSADDDAQK